MLLCLCSQVPQKVAKLPVVSNNPHGKCVWCRQVFYRSSNYVFPDTAAQTICRCSEERLDMFNGEKCRETTRISLKLGETSFLQGVSTSSYLHYARGYY